MQNFIRKFYFILFVSVLTNSFSAINSYEKNAKLIDSLIVKQQFKKAHASLSAYINENDSVSKKMVVTGLYLSSMVSDTSAFLTYQAIGVKYFPNYFAMSDLNDYTDKFENNRFFYGFKLWLTRMLKLHSLLITVLCLGLILVGVVVTFYFSYHQMSVTGVCCVLLFTVLLFFTFLNWSYLVPAQRYYVKSDHHELRIAPSYAASISSENIKKGELMQLLDETEVWISVSYKGKKYYLAQQQNPFIF